ncbi:O-antigen ligase family protein [Candidatus Peregrinibacteria bacterium]|nr:O-antigen ligase family protein [Candidatus Peregrinibacteria bacterium]
MEITYIAIFVAWAVLAFNYPKIFVIILSALFPAYLIKFSFYGIPFTAVEWLVYATALAFALRYYKKIFEWGRDFFESGFYKKIDTWVFIFFIFSLVAALLTPASGREHAFGILKGWIIAPILYFFIIRSIIKNLADSRRILDAYSFSAAVLGVWAIQQYLHGFLIDGRAVGPFASANYLAFFLAPAFVYSAISAWHNIKTIEMPWWKKVFIKLFKKEVEETNLAMFFVYLVFALITGSSLIFSNSYGAFFGIIAALIFYGIYHYFFSPWKQSFDSSIKKISILIVILITIFGIIVPKYDKWKFDTLLDFKGGTSSEIRLETWGVAGKLIERKPVFGIGLGRFQDEYKASSRELLGKEPFRPEMLHSHNLLMETWLNVGVFGLAAFLAMLFLFFALIKARVNDVRKRFLILLCSMMIIIFVHGLIDTTFWKNDLALQFWMIMGVAFALKK